MRESSHNSFFAPLALCFCLGASATPLMGQDCPAGVLDSERAYFGSTLSSNSCDTADALCEQVFFFSEQRLATAVCRSGRWLLEEDENFDTDSCPAFVFSSGEIWSQGSYAPNSCQAGLAPVCDSTFFDRLPEGGSGYRAAECVDGRWQVEGVASQAPFRLRRVRSTAELVEFLKGGLRQTFGNRPPFAFGPTDGPFTGGASGEPSSPAPPPAADVQLSETNVQEAGVDEEDRIESDGEYLYILKNYQSLRSNNLGQPGENRIRVLRVDPQAPSAQAIGELRLGLEEQQFARGLYLRSEADQLVATASTLDLNWFYWYSPLAWQGTSSSVTSVDVSDPAHPVQATTIEIDGEIISSRRIGSVLYLATRFYPFVQGVGFYSGGGAEARQIEERIEATSVSELLPSYRTSAGSEPRLLVSPSDCYLPTETAPVTTSDVISLVAVDLDAMEVTSSKCFVGATETLYVSLESVYVASTRYNYTLTLGDDAAPWVIYSSPTVQTDLHKFSLNGGAISYEASGAVDGHLGFNVARKPFRLSEQGSDLRAITYTQGQDPYSSPVAITVLRDSGDDELREIGRLPNERRPDPVGKPGELLYATRFVGNLAYLVTFRMTDPLYVVDLSRPEDPLVAGELVINGYSDYLHPLPGGYLIGVGKDAIPDPSGDFRGAWYQGLKVALYDVTDPSHPFEADSLTLGRRGSEAPVLQDHRAFTFLSLEGERPRFAIGTRIHERPRGGPVQPWTFFDWSYSGLHLFEVDTAAGRVVDQGSMRVEKSDESSGNSGFSFLHGEDRSVLAGDAIFYVHGDDLYTALWGNPEQFEGPE